MNSLIRQSLCSFLLLLTFQTEAAVSDISRIYRAPVSLSHLEICQGGGCAESQVISLTAAEWQKVETIFQAQQPFTAENERKNIAQAIGLIERLVGEKTGTAGDRAGTFDNSDYAGQMDCNDEAINTTSYIRLMQQQGLIKLHAIEDLRTRNFFFTGWPHTTAVIHETASGKRFAVDSWFYDNGETASIVPFEVWKADYVPSDSPLQQSNRRP
jgi:hypothetical protein